MKNLNDVISGVDQVINSAKQGNFEEVLNKTKNYAEIATKKSAERLEVSRKKIELLDSKTKLAKAYEKYGKLAYARDNGEEADEEKIASAVAEIELQLTRSELLNKEIEELREVFAETIGKKETKTSEQPEPKVEVTVVEPVDE